MATSGVATVLAGESSVSVAHSFGSSSFVVQINTTRDVGAVTYTDKTASSFTINISNMDFEADTVIDWSLLTVDNTVAPSATQYCLVASITDMPDVPTYQELGFADQSTYEDYISRMITACSRFIDRRTRRPTGYYNGGATVTECMDGKSTGSSAYTNTKRSAMFAAKSRTYRLDQSPVISVTSVSQNSAQVGATPVWEAITAYSIDNDTGEVCFSPSVSINPKSAFYSKNLRFIYTAGYSTVPDEIAAACEELVANGLKKVMMDQLNSRVRFSRPAPISFSDKSVFTDDVKELLEPYVKVRL